jgi:hypothetical protein
MAETRFPNLGPADERLAEAMFEFVQFLLDDDANLTPAGNLAGTARQRLRTRLQELIAAEETARDAGDTGTSAVASDTTGGAA